MEKTARNLRRAVIIDGKDPLARCVHNASSMRLITGTTLVIVPLMGLGLLLAGTYRAPAHSVAKSDKLATFKGPTLSTGAER